MTIVDLPNEIIRRIALILTGDFSNHCLENVESIQSFRLACKLFAAVGTEALFKTVVVVPEKDAFQLEDPPRDPGSSLGKLSAIQNSPSLVNCVRSVVLRTSIDEQEYHDRGDDVSEEWQEVVSSSLSKFPNLESVHVVFRPGCYGDDNDYNWKTESEGFRSEFLEVSLFPPY